MSVASGTAEPARCLATGLGRSTASW
jgi:hypothetical protein